MYNLWLAIGKCCSSSDYFQELLKHKRDNCSEMKLLRDMYKYFYKEKFYLSRWELMEFNYILSEISGKEIEDTGKNICELIQDAWGKSGGYPTNNEKFLVAFGVACIEESIREDISFATDAEEVLASLKNKPPFIDLVDVNYAKKLIDLVSEQASPKNKVIDLMVEFEKTGWVIGLQDGLLKVACAAGTSFKEGYVQPRSANAQFVLRFGNEDLREALTVPELSKRVIDALGLKVDPTVEISATSAERKSGH